MKRTEHINMVAKPLHRSVDLVNSVGKSLATKQLIKGKANSMHKSLKSTCNIFSVPRQNPERQTTKDKILLSISGGQDSICLLVILNQLCAQMEFKLGLVWCHHLWQIDSFSLMRQITKISYLFQLNSCFAITPKPIPSELLARNWRHDCSARICFFYNYYKMSLAHSASDKTETILLNLMRGTGIAGLSPLSWEKKNTVQNIKQREHVSQLLRFADFQLFFFIWSPFLCNIRDVTHETRCTRNKGHFKEAAKVTAGKRQTHPVGAKVVLSNLLCNIRAEKMHHVTHETRCKKDVVHRRCKEDSAPKVQRQMHMHCALWRSEFHSKRHMVKQVGERKTTESCILDTLPGSSLNVKRLNNFLLVHRMWSSKDATGKSHKKNLGGVCSASNVHNLCALHPGQLRWGYRRKTTDAKNWKMKDAHQLMQRKMSKPNNLLSLNSKKWFYSVSHTFLKTCSISFEQIKRNSQNLHHRLASEPNLLCTQDTSHVSLPLHMHLLSNLLCNIRADAMHTTPALQEANNTILSCAPSGLMRCAQSHLPHRCANLRFSKASEITKMNVKRHGLHSITQQEYLWTIEIAYLVSDRIHYLHNAPKIVKRRKCTNTKEGELERSCKGYRRNSPDAFVQLNEKSCNCELHLEKNPSTIRPLLALNRFDISKLCIYWELPVYPDQSNQKMRFLRNRVRKQLLPTIKLFFNSRIENILLQFSEIFSDEDHYMNQITDKLFYKLDSANTFIHSPSFAGNFYHNQTLLPINPPPTFISNSLLAQCTSDVSLPKVHRSDCVTSLMLKKEVKNGVLAKQEKSEVHECNYTEGVQGSSSDWVRFLQSKSQRCKEEVKNGVLAKQEKSKIVKRGLRAAKLQRLPQVVHQRCKDRCMGKCGEVSSIVSQAEPLRLRLCISDAEHNSKRLLSSLHLPSCGTDEMLQRRFHSTTFFSNMFTILLPIASNSASLNAIRKLPDSICTKSATNKAITKHDVQRFVYTKRVPNHDTEGFATTFQQANAIFECSIFSVSLRFFRFSLLAHAPQVQVQSFAKIQRRKYIVVPKIYKLCLCTFGALPAVTSDVSLSSLGPLLAKQEPKVVKRRKLCTAGAKKRLCTAGAKKIVHQRCRDRCITGGSDCVTSLMLKKEVKNGVLAKQEKSEVFSHRYANLLCNILSIPHERRCKEDVVHRRCKEDSAPKVQRQMQAKLCIESAPPQAQVQTSQFLLRGTASNREAVWGNPINQDKKEQQITFNYFISFLYSKSVADRLIINVVDHDQLTFNLLWTEIQLNGHYVTPSSSPSGLLLFKRLYKSSETSDILYPIKTIPRYSVPMRATFWVWNRKLYKAKKFTEISTSYRCIKSNSLFSFYQTGLTENFNEQQYTHICAPEVDASSCTVGAKTSHRFSLLLCTSSFCFARSGPNCYNAQFTTHNTHASGGATCNIKDVIGVRRCKGSDCVPRRSKEEVKNGVLAKQEKSEVVIACPEGAKKMHSRRLCIFFQIEDLTAEQNQRCKKELTSEAGSAHMKDVSDKLLTPCFYILNVYTKQKNVLLSTLNKPFNWNRNSASISKRKIIITSLASSMSAIKADVMVHSRSSASNQFFRKCKCRTSLAPSILNSARLCIESAPPLVKQREVSNQPFRGCKCLSLLASSLHLRLLLCNKRTQSRPLHLRLCIGCLSFLHLRCTTSDVSLQCTYTEGVLHDALTPKVYCTMDLRCKSATVQRCKGSDCHCVTSLMLKEDASRRGKEEVKNGVLAKQEKSEALALQEADPITTFGCISSAPKVHCALCIVQCKRQKMKKLPFLGLKRCNSITNHGTSCRISAPINVRLTCSNSLDEWRSVKEATIHLALATKLELSARIAIGRFFAPSVMDQRWKSRFLRDSAWQTDKSPILDPRIALKANKKKKDTNKLVNIFYKFDKLERDKKEIYWPLIISFLPKAIQRRFVKLFLVNQNLKQVRYSQIEQFLSIIKKF